MGRAVAVLVLAAGLALGATGVVAAAPGKRSLHGTITSIGAARITVHGRRTLTCRIAPGTPAPRAAGFRVGTRAFVTCLRGVLKSLRAHGASPGTSISSSSSRSSSVTVTTSSNGVSSGASTDAVVGPITALGNGTITLARSVTCRVEDGSPGVAGYSVGDRVAAGCRNGVLVELKRA